MYSSIIGAKSTRTRTFAGLYLWTLVVVATLLPSTPAFADTHYAYFNRFVPGTDAARNEVLRQLNGLMESFRYEFMTTTSDGMVSSEIVADYCFARSRLLAGALTRLSQSVSGLEVVGHLQIDLRAPGSNWTYHVAPVIRLGGVNGEVFVADSIDGYRTISAWANVYGSSRLRIVNPGGPAHDGVFDPNAFNLGVNEAELAARTYETTNWMALDSEQAAQLVDAMRVVGALQRLRQLLPTHPNTRMADVLPEVEEAIRLIPQEERLGRMRAGYGRSTEWLERFGGICP